jgi:hypothetical protein
VAEAMVAITVLDHLLCSRDSAESLGV